MIKRARYRYIPIYYNKVTQEIEGRNFFAGWLLNLVLFWDLYVVPVEGFPIWIEQD